MPEERDAKCYADGAWTTVPDELWAAWPEGGTDDEALKTTGYERWVRVGDPDALALPMTLTVYSRDAEPRYLVAVEGLATSMEWVYARDLPDVMELLSTWLPTVQAAALSEVVRQFNNPGGENLDMITLIKELLGRT